MTIVQFDKVLYAGRKYVPEKSDLRTLFDVNGKKILFYSATDYEEYIKNLKEILNRLEINGVTLDVLVTSCRRYDENEFKIMLKEMNWREEDNMLLDKEGDEIIQIPAIKVKNEHNPKGVIDWYNNLTVRLLQHLLEAMLF